MFREYEECPLHLGTHCLFVEILTGRPMCCSLAGSPTSEQHVATVSRASLYALVLQLMAQHLVRCRVDQWHMVLDKIYCRFEQCNMNLDMRTCFFCVILLFAFHSLIQFLCLNITREFL